MNLNETMAELERLGTAQSKKVLARHGAREPFFGVKIGDLMELRKQAGVDHALALELWATGNSDAMVFAGMIADPAKFTKAELRRWAREAYWYHLSEYAVARCAAACPHGWDLALEWIERKAENVAAAGWATLSNIVSTTPDEELDVESLENLLGWVESDIEGAQNRVRYTMNGFVIAVGCFVKGLTKPAESTARAIGTVQVEMGETECKVPNALETIRKLRKMGRIGKKRVVA